GVRRGRPHSVRRRSRRARGRRTGTGARLPRARLPRSVMDAVVFDLDGVLVDSEQLWDEVREQLARERGGRWHERAQAEMMGMSSLEWSRYMREQLGVPEAPEEISAEVVRRLEDV